MDRDRHASVPTVLSQAAPFGNGIPDEDELAVLQATSHPVSLKHPPHADYYQWDSLHMKTLSAKELVRTSAVQVTKELPEDRRRQLTVRLDDARFGAADQRYCSRCGNKYSECYGHHGYLQLCVPVPNILFVDEWLLPLLRCLCVFCGRLLLPDDHPQYDELVSVPSPAARLAGIAEVCEGMAFCESYAARSVRLKYNKNKGFRARHAHLHAELACAPFYRAVRPVVPMRPGGSGGAVAEAATSGAAGTPPQQQWVEPYPHKYCGLRNPAVWERLVGGLVRPCFLLSEADLKLANTVVEQQQSNIGWVQPVFTTHDLTALLQSIEPATLAILGCPWLRPAPASGTTSVPAAPSAQVPAPNSDRGPAAGGAEPAEAVNCLSDLLFQTVYVPPLYVRPEVHRQDQRKDKDHDFTKRTKSIRCVDTNLGGVRKRLRSLHAKALQSGNAGLKNLAHAVHWFSREPVDHTDQSAEFGGINLAVYRLVSRLDVANGRGYSHYRSGFYTKQNGPGCPQLLGYREQYKVHLHQMAPVSKRPFRHCEPAVKQWVKEMEKAHEDALSTFHELCAEVSGRCIKTEGVVTGPQARRSKAISLQDLYFQGKVGRFRQSLEGKRSDYTARLVIVPGVEHINDCWIPRWVARDLTVPVRVHAHNRATLLNYVRQGHVDHIVRWHSHPHESRSLMRPVTFFMDNFPAEDVVLKDGDVVHRHTMDGDVLMLTRMPHLRTCSTMGYRVRVKPGEVPQENAVLHIHHAHTKATNHDFDGDEMTIGGLQTLLARSEVAQLMLVEKHIVYDGQPQVVYQQHCLYMLHHLTQPQTLLSVRQVDALLAAFSVWSPYRHALWQQWKSSAVSEVRSADRPCVPGHRVFSLWLPETFEWSHGSTNTRVSRGQLVHGTLSGRNLNGTSGLQHVFYLTYGSALTGNFTSSVYLVSRVYPSVVGAYTFGPQDYWPSLEVKDADQAVLASQLPQVWSALQRWLVQHDRSQALDVSTFLRTAASVPCSLERDHPEALRMINWVAGLHGGARLCQIVNHSQLHRVFNSGAKGSFATWEQLAGCVGQQYTQAGERLAGSVNPAVRDPLAPLSEPWLPRSTQGTVEQQLRSRGMVFSSYAQGLHPDELVAALQTASVNLADKSTQTPMAGMLSRQVSKKLETTLVMQSGVAATAERWLVSVRSYQDGLDPHWLRPVQLLSVPTKPDSDGSPWRPEWVSRLSHTEQRQYRQLCTAVFGQSPRYLLGGHHDGLATVWSPVCVTTLRAHVRHVQGWKNDTTCDQSHDGAWSDVWWSAQRLAWTQQFALTPRLQLYLFEQCNSVRCAHWSHEECRLVAQAVGERFRRAMLAFGEPVGPCVALSVCEQSTQKTLDAFHGHGVDAFTRKGLKRTSELMSVCSADKVQNPSMTVFLRHADWSADQCSRWAAVHLLQVLCADLCSSVPLDSSAFWQRSDVLSQVSAASSLLQRPLSRPFCVVVRLCPHRLAHHNLDAAEVALRLSRSHPSVVWLSSPRDWLSRGTHEDDTDSTHPWLMMEVHPQSALVSHWQHKNPRLNFTGRSEVAARVIVQMARVWMLKQRVRGTTSIKSVRVVPHAVMQYSASEGLRIVSRQAIQTKGSCLAAVLALPDVDPTLTTTNVVPEMMAVFGIEVGRRSLEQQLLVNQNETEFGMLQRSVHVLSERWAMHGTLLGSTATNISHEPGGSALYWASHGKAFNNFVLGCALHQKDDCVNVTQACMVGKPIPIGTAAVTVVHQLSLGKSQPDDDTRLHNLVVRSQQHQSAYAQSCECTEAHLEWIWSELPTV